MVVQSALGCVSPRIGFRWRRDCHSLPTRRGNYIEKKRGLESVVAKRVKTLAWIAAVLHRHCDRVFFANQDEIYDWHTDADKRTRGTIPTRFALRVHHRYDLQ